MPRIFVDYTLIGHARQFDTLVKAKVREQLRRGHTVIVYGDGVPPARARVLTVSADCPVVELELLDA